MIKVSTYMNDLHVYEARRETRAGVATLRCTYATGCCSKRRLYGLVGSSFSAASIRAMVAALLQELYEDARISPTDAVLLEYEADGARTAQIFKRAGFQELYTYTSGTTGLRITVLGYDTHEFRDKYLAKIKKQAEAKRRQGARYAAT